MKLQAKVSVGLLVIGVAAATGGVFYVKNKSTNDSKVDFVAAVDPQQSVLDQTANATSTNTVNTTSQSNVLEKAQAFLATLSDEQKPKVLLGYTKENVTAWSNFPIGIYGSRVGIQLLNLNDTQKTTLNELLKTTLGTSNGAGYDQVQQILAADDYLGTMQGGYGSTNYFIAFLGTPANTGTWELQFGGHHLAVANTYKDGVLVSATPSFRAVEPTSWESATNTMTPMNAEVTAIKAVVASLTEDQKTAAKLSTSFSDIVVGPQKDGQFPAAKSGIRVGDLSSEQKQKVLDYIKTWVGDIDETSANKIMKKYESELDDTYISYVGTGEFNTNADYLRVDGPSVWIEFSCQGGIVIKGKVHYHAVWRDKTKDYAGSFIF